MMLFRHPSAARALVAAAALWVQTTTLAAEPIDFARDIRPILQERCVKCHGAEKQKGGLRFDHQAGALKAGDSGEQAIIAGHAGKSELMRLVRSGDSEEWMPPKGERLSAREIDLLQRWIDGGAEWPESASPAQPGANELAVTEEDRRHWAYRAASREDDVVGAQPG